MKNPDLMNFLPIDQIKVLTENNPYRIETDLESPVCVVDHSIIDYSLFDSKPAFEQNRMKVPLLKVIDINKATSTNFKEGIEIIEIVLNSIGYIKSYK